MVLIYFHSISQNFFILAVSFQNTYLLHIITSQILITIILLINTVLDINKLSLRLWESVILIDYILDRSLASTIDVYININKLCSTIIIVVCLKVVIWFSWIRDFTIMYQIF